MYVIYKHTLMLDCPHNGWSYIGQTTQKLAHRWGRGSGYKDQLFGEAIKNYGWENFSHDILEKNIKTLEEANEREKYWISYYHTWVQDPERKGYNATQGGDGSIGRPSTNRKAVICIETNIIYESITAAAEAAHITVSMIWCCVAKKNILGGGYHWAYADDLDYIMYLKTLTGQKKKGSRQCKVICVETEEVFDFIKDAANKYNLIPCKISACCKGKRHTTGGFHWKYLD